MRASDHQRSANNHGAGQRFHLDGRLALSVLVDIEFRVDLVEEPDNAAVQMPAEKLVLAAQLLEIAYAGDLLFVATLVIEVTNDLKDRHNLTVVDELPNRCSTRHDPRDHALDLLGDRQASLLTPDLPSV